MDIPQILNEINRCFESDLLLDEFDFINTTEPPFIVHAQEHKLGISISVIQPLYRYLLQKFDEFNFKRYDQEISVLTDREDANELINVTRGLLLVKGDHPIAFQRRKELIINNFIDCSTEIAFLNVLFTKHPKSPSAWQHRRFCLLRKFGLSLPLSVTIGELEICRKFSESHPKNYYSWTHRLYIIEDITLNQMKDELDFTLSWLESHVSDHSAANHRLQVILRIMHLIMNHPDIELDLGDLRYESYFSYFNHSPVITLLGKVMDDSSFLITKRPGNESLWCHRRSILQVTLPLLQTVSTIHQNSEEFVTKLFHDCLGNIKELVSFLLTDNHFTSLHDLEKIDSKQLFSQGDVSPLYDVLLLIKFESTFVLSCVKETSCWNYDKQVIQALKYLLFLFFKIRRSLVGSEITESARTASNLSIDACIGTLINLLKVRQDQPNPLLNHLFTNN